MPEYIPSRSLILVALEPKDDQPWNAGTYAAWFEHTYKRGTYIRQFGKKKVLKMTLRRGRKAGVENVNVLFDMANGHSSTKRYLWIFPSRREAEEHRKKQHASEGAQLSEPFPYHRTA